MPTNPHTIYADDLKVENFLENPQLSVVKTWALRRTRTRTSIRGVSTLEALAKQLIREPENSLNKRHGDYQKKKRAKKRIAT